MHPSSLSKETVTIQLNHLEKNLLSDLPIGLEWVDLRKDEERAKVESWMNRARSVERVSSLRLHSGGIFLRVSAVEGTLPVLHLVHSLDDYSNSESEICFILLTEENAKLTLIHEFCSSAARTPQKDERRRVSGHIQILASRSSKINYSQIQNINLMTNIFFDTRVELEQDAAVQLSLISAGGNQTETKVESICLGSGSEIKSHVACIGVGQQKAKLEFIAHHPVSHTKSELDLWCVMKDCSRMSFNGNIIIPQSGLFTEAYQKNHNLILSPSASVETTPKLEIATDEVKVAHGASVSPINPEQMYYLESRGISPEEAQNMIVDGFTYGVISKLPTEELQNRMRTILGEQDRGSRIPLEAGS